MAFGAEGRNVDTGGDPSLDLKCASVPSVPAMEILGLVLVGLYALLNAALTVGSLLVESTAGPIVRLGSAALFLVAAVVLAWGGWHRETGWVFAGLVLAVGGLWWATSGR